MKFNYITWFGIIFFIASYIRLYPHQIFKRKSFWGWMTLATVLLATISIVGMQLIVGRANYQFVHDSNKLFAVAVSICSFLWFKNMDIKYSKVINAFGAATFGVLLIHANSDAMRTWLWKDVVDTVGHYKLSVMQLAFFSVGVVLAVFIICNLIDQLRTATVEKAFLKWYDKHIDNKLNNFVKTK